MKLTNLSDTNQELRRIFGNFPVGICELSLSGDKIIQIDDLLPKIIGYTKAELMAMQVVDIPTKDLLPKFFTRMVKIANGERISKTRTYRIVAKDGSIKTIKSHILKIIHDDEGYPVNALVAYAEVPRNSLKAKK